MGSVNSKKVRKPRVSFLAVQAAAVLVALALIVIGLLGFIPRATIDLDALQLGGPGSDARLFGVFQVSILLNLVHLALGGAGLVLVRTFAKARAFLLGGGLVCLGLWIYGLLVDPHSAANVLAVNNADNWLHFGLGVAMIILGVTLAGSRIPTGADGAPLLPDQ